MATLKTGPLSTCRFDTRIDLVFVSKDLLNTEKEVNVTTVDDTTASDHNLVVAEFTIFNKSE